MAEKVNEEIKRAKTELEVMSMDPKEREMYEEREIAKRLLKMGFEIEKISEITELSEEIKKLK